MNPKDALRLLAALDMGLAVDAARAMFQAADAAGEPDVSGRIEAWMEEQRLKAKNA